jgi:multiple sugar transport system substrate-binding protein
MRKSIQSACGLDRAQLLRAGSPATEAPGQLRRRPRRVAVAAAAAGLALVAAGCSSGSPAPAASSGKATVTFANWAETEANTEPGINAMIKKFESLYPNITIKQQPISYTDIDHQLLLEVKSGNAPDVAELQGDYTYDLAATGDLESLSSYLTSSVRAEFIPRELKLGDIGGKQVAIPWTVGPFALWYNKTIMTQAGLSATPPGTWTQLLSDLKVIHAKFPKIIDFGTDSTSREYGLDQNWPVMQSFGGTPFHGTTATADTTAFENYLSFMRTIDQDGYTPEGEKGGYFRQPAASNQVAFTIDGPYVKGVVQSVNHESNTAFYSNWGIAPLPAGPSGVHYSTPTDHQLVMFASTPANDRQAAWQFMTWLSTSTYAITNYTIPYEGSIPPLAHPAGAVQKQLDNPISQEFIKNVIPTVNTPDWGAQYSSAYLDVMAAIQQAMTSSTPVSSIASSLQSQLGTDLAGQTGP